MGEAFVLLAPFGPKIAIHLSRKEAKLGKKIQ